MLFDLARELIRNDLRFTTMNVTRLSTGETTRIQNKFILHILQIFQDNLKLHDEKNPENRIPVFDATNIADYTVNNKGEINCEVFGCIKLPFPCVWLEAPTNKLFSEVNTQENKVAIFLLEDEELHQIYYIYLLGSKNSIRIIPILFALQCNENWEIIEGQDYRFSSFIKEDNIEQESIDIAERFSAVHFLIIHLLMFLHTKNVQILKKVHPDKIQKKREKKNKLPLVATRIITIRGVTERFEREQTITGETTVPYTIVRGHFADYRKKGLFGKYKGIFWIPQHSRGSYEHGTVKNRYKIGEIGKS